MVVLTWVINFDPVQLFIQKSNVVIQKNHRIKIMYYKQIIILRINFSIIPYNYLLHFFCYPMHRMHYKLGIVMIITFQLKKTKNKVNKGFNVLTNNHFRCGFDTIVRNVSCKEHIQDQAMRIKRFFLNDLLAILLLEKWKSIIIIIGFYQKSLYVALNYLSWATCQFLRWHTDISQTIAIYCS